MPYPDGAPQNVLYCQVVEASSYDGLMPNRARALTDTCAEPRITDCVIAAEDAVRGHALGLARDRSAQKAWGKSLIEAARANYELWADNRTLLYQLQGRGPSASAVAGVAPQGGKM